MEIKSINLKVWGIKGSSPRREENKGAVTIFLRNGETQQGHICVDMFEGEGSTYKRRENAEITISTWHDTIFEGTFEQLIEKLR